MHTRLPPIVVQVIGPQCVSVAFTPVLRDVHLCLDHSGKDVNARCERVLFLAPLLSPTLGFSPTECNHKGVSL